MKQQIIGPNPIFVNSFANSILSTAGSGDVLAGIIGGLVASREKDPALLGVWLHSEAARILLESGEPRIAASEIISKLGKAISRLNTKNSQLSNRVVETNGTIQTDIKCAYIELE